MSGDVAEFVGLLLVCAGVACVSWAGFLVATWLGFGLLGVLLLATGLALVRVGHLAGDSK